MGSSRDVIAFGGVGTLGIIAARADLAGLLLRGGVMGGWLVLIAVMGAAWLIFHD